MIFNHDDMPRDTKTFSHSDSSDDDDDLPPLSRLSNIIVKGPQKKIFDDLFKENAELIQSQKRQYKDLKEIASFQIHDTLNDEENSLLGNEDSPLYEKNKKLLEKTELDEKNETDAFKEQSLQLFGKLNHLQFITWDDLTLPKCGFDSSLDFSELENLLIALNENELHEEIKCCEAFSPKNFKQLNPFVQYVFKTMSLHSDPAYVNACQKFIKKMISKSQYLKNISISSADIFMVLFNYGVDVKKHSFYMLPGSKEIQKSEITKEIPQNWMFNMKAVLLSIGDLMEHCKMQEDDLVNIFIYLLWMSMDDFLNINMALQLCSEIILCKFSTENWPCRRLKIVKFVISTIVQMSNHWNLLLKMLKCLYCETPRGAELRNYLSYIALRKLADDTSDSNLLSKYFIPEYSEKLFCVKNLQPILESVHDMKKSSQMVAIEFINLFTMSLKLSFKEEHSKLLISLKRCENSISQHATIQQSRLCIIHSRISTLTPHESVKEMFDTVEKQEEISDNTEKNASMHDIETNSNASKSPLDEQLFCEEPRTGLMFDTVEKQEEILDNTENDSMHDIELDSHTSKSSLDEQSFCEEPRASLASYASNDESKKQNDILQSFITDQDGSQEITEKLASKEKCATIDATIASQSSLNQQLVNKKLKENLVLGMSKEMFLNENNNTLKDTVTGPLVLKSENSEDKSPERNQQRINDVTHLCSMDEQLVDGEQTVLLNGGEVALELSVNSKVLNPEPNSNVELKGSSERLDTESDIETETSSEREDCISDENMSSGRQDYVSPTKSFLSDHRYAKRECSTNSSANLSKNLNTCFDKLAQSNDQYRNKLPHSTYHSEGKNLLKKVRNKIVHFEIAEDSNKNSAACIKIVPNLNSHKSFKKYSQESSNKVDNAQTPFIDSTTEKIISDFQDDTAQSKVLQNSTSSQNLISCAASENSRDSTRNRNAFLNVENYDKVKFSEFVRSNEVDNTEAAFIDSTIEKIISEIQSDSAESKILWNSASLQNLISCVASENSRDSMGDKNVVSNVEHVDMMKPELVKSIEVDNIKAPIDASIFEKIITYKNSLTNECDSIDLLTKNQSTFPKELTHLNNDNICNKKCESVSQANAENICNFTGVLPPMTDASEPSNNDARIVCKLLNVENYQNVVRLQPKDIPVSPPSRHKEIPMHPSTKSDAVNHTKNMTSELFSEINIPKEKNTNGSAKVSSDDAITTEKLTTSIIIVPQIDLNPLYCDNSNFPDIFRSTAEKSKENSNFIPRSVHIKTAKTMHSSDLGVHQNSKKEIASNFQNSVQNSSVEENETFNSFEKKTVINTDIFPLGTKLDCKKGESVKPLVQIPESDKILEDKAKIDMFFNASESDQRMGFQSNIVHLRSVENIKGSDIGKVNSNDDSKRKNLCTPSPNNILSENREFLTSNYLPSTTKPVPSVEHKNIALSKQLSRVETSSEFQPHSIEFSTQTIPNTSCLSPKRKHRDSISHLVAKRARIPERINVNSLQWQMNFPASSSPAQILKGQNETETCSVVPLADNSSVYYTAICKAQQTDEILANRESSEAVTDHSNDAEHIKNQENSEIINTDISSKSSSYSDSGSSSDLDSSRSSETCSSSFKNLKSQSTITKIKKCVNQNKRNNSLKATQNTLSDSEDEIQIIEEINKNKTSTKNKPNNIKTSTKNKSNKFLPSHVMDKRQLCTFNTTKSNNSDSRILEKSVKSESRTPKKSVKYASRTPKKSVKYASRTPKKSGNLVQKVSNSVSSPPAVKKSSNRVLFTTVPSVNTNNSTLQASGSQNQDDDIVCLDDEDTDADCSILDYHETITLD